MPFDPTAIPAQAKLVSVAEMQAVEKAADAAGHSYAAMMERAGAAVAETVVAHYGVVHPQVTVLVGPGNNGGDGLVCARHLQQVGIAVRVYVWKRKIDPQADQDSHYAQVVQLGIETAHADDDGDFSTLRSWLNESTLVVDALLGTGVSRPLSGQVAELLDTVRAAITARPHLDVVAVDCISGLNCDTGEVDPHAVAANVTVTFAYAKYGHYQFPGVEATGVLEVADIGVYDCAYPSLPTFLLQEQIVRQWLPARPRLSHKGSFGKVMAAVGSQRFPGAAYLSCAAAGRIGAGLVTGAVAEPVWPVVAGQLPEPTWLPLPAGQAHAQRGISEAAAALVGQAVSEYDALLLGCGLGQLPTTQRFVTGLLQTPELPPTVIDADALNALARRQDWPQLLPQNAVLTPHAGELARLCGATVDDVLRTRWNLARQQAANWRCVVLAKGPYTVIAHMAGWLGVLPVATPALATAGTGDVLAGVITGLIAQDVEPFQAACLGAWLHGAAGLLCERELGAAGVMASDLVARLPRVMQHLRETR